MAPSLGRGGPGPGRVWALVLALVALSPWVRGDAPAAAAPPSATAGAGLGASASAAVSASPPAAAPVSGLVSAAVPDSATAASAPAPPGSASSPAAAATPSGPAALSVPVLGLSRPGRPGLELPSLSPDAPLFPVGAAASYAGFTARWRSSEKLLELRDRGRVRARLVVGDAFAVLGGRLLRLPGPLQLAGGAPALDAEGLEALLGALGASGLGMDVSGGSVAGAAPGPAAPAPLPPRTVLIAPVPTAHVAARPLTGARIRTIVVDAGHGGKDPGAHGPDGLREKDVCLDIALRLRRELNRRDPSVRVVLTRDGDYFVTLQGRTRIANAAKGDLFVSIHNNASPDPGTHGTQVFFFDSQSSDRAAADLSLRENAEANQLDILMTDLAKSIVRDQSIGFASLVQHALGRAIKLKHRDVSYAPFYVLARTEMPAILVEVAFITNPREERLLGSASFRQRVAVSLAEGLEDYSRLAAGKP